MILNIKPAVRSQLTEIMEAFCSSVGLKAEECGNYTEYFESSIKNALLTAVITCDKTVRGVCVCESSPIPDACEIRAIYIADEYKSKGFGRKLLSFALREMRSAGYKTAFLWVDEGDARTEKFFNKFGFESDGRRRRNVNSSGNIYELRYRIDI